MDANLQKLLSDIAKCARLTVDFSNDEHIRISSFQDGESPFLLISSERPDSELIFAILQKIGLVPTHTSEFHFPGFLNRAYENETAGEVVYRTRRTLRHKCNSEWRAGLWALCAYVQIGQPVEFRDFLKRHPEKLKLMPLVWIGTLKARALRFFSRFR